MNSQVVGYMYAAETYICENETVYRPCTNQKFSLTAKVYDQSLLAVLNKNELILRECSIRDKIKFKTFKNHNYRNSIKK